MLTDRLWWSLVGSTFQTRGLTSLVLGKTQQRYCGWREESVSSGKIADDNSGTESRSVRSSRAWAYEIMDNLQQCFSEYYLATWSYLRRCIGTAFKNTEPQKERHALRIFF